MRTVQGLIEEFERKLAASSPIHRFDIQAEWIKGGRQGRLLGNILTAPALRRLVITLAKATGVDWDASRVRVEERVIREFGQFSQAGQVWRMPAEDSALVTEYGENEWVKVLGEANGYSFVLTEDGARGWIPSEQLTPRTHSSPWTAEWFKRGSTVGTQARSQDLIQDARTLLGCPYLLGGKRDGGIDCSAYVQRIFQHRCQRLLPRHSWDQKDYGQPVDSHEAEPADLFFGLSRRGHHKHVGMLISPSLMIHASKRAGKVTIWERELFESFYQVVVMRRLVDFA